MDYFSILPRKIDVKNWVWVSPAQKIRLTKDLRLKTKNLD